MTVVAAIVTPEGAWMGSDSLASTNDTCSLTVTPKMGRFGQSLVGFAGDWRLGRIILQRWGFTPTIGLEHFYDSLKWGKDEWEGFDLLVVENGRIYEISGGGLLEVPITDGHSYGAIGSGAQAALGALYCDSTDESSLMQALEASAFHTPTVRGPFRTICL